MVLISVRERESLLNSTVNVVLANLCAANLVSAVFVKSIAVVYNGYAVARCSAVLKNVGNAKRSGNIAASLNVAFTLRHGGI